MKQKNFSPNIKNSNLVTEIEFWKFGKKNAKYLWKLTGNPRLKSAKT